MPETSRPDLTAPDLIGVDHALARVARMQRRALCVIGAVVAASVGVLTWEIVTGVIHR